MNKRQPHEEIIACRYLRKNMTPAEKLLWEHLRDRRMAAKKFRRQHPVGPFILDFYCLELRLAVEVDGEIHEKQVEYDCWRDAQLWEIEGITTLRFTNEEVLKQISFVLKKVFDTIRGLEEQI